MFNLNQGPDKYEQVLRYNHKRVQCRKLIRFWIICTAISAVTAVLCVLQYQKNPTLFVVVIGLIHSALVVVGAARAFYLIHNLDF